MIYHSRDFWVSAHPNEAHGSNNSHFDREPLFVNRVSCPMDEEKVHFTKKRVDESWKENISKEKGDTSEVVQPASASFSTFITSLGLQALIRMGEFKPPGNEKIEVDFDAAQETIDLLLMLKEKTKANVTPEEEALLNSLIADLQLKFVQHKMS